MRHFTDPAELSTEQRRGELVCILAAGVLRLLQRRLLVGESLAQIPTITPKSAAERLEFAGETVLSVHTG